MSATTISQSSSSVLPAPALRAIARFRAARALRAERNRVRFELDQYSDRELSDIGLGRGDIESVVASVRIAR